MYRLSKDDVKLLNNLLLLKDLNPEDGYSKENVIEYVKADRELNEAELNQIRNYVLDKNLEYGFKENDEPNELGYATEELGDKLFYIMEDESDKYMLILSFLSYLCDVYIIDEIANCIRDIISSMNLVNRFIEFFC